MDATQTRTAAEVMGWRSNGRPDMTPAEVNDWLAGMGYGEPLGPTVDDMLAFLTGPQDRNIDVEVRRQSKWGGSQIVVVTVHRGLVSEHHKAPTLHASLELAVIAVGGAE
jgi:hypothetical protein